jgi:hypothetical protein
LVSGIQLTIQGDPTKIIVFENVVNGTNSSSILRQTGSRIEYKSAAAPMSTGKLYANQSTVWGTGTFIYSRLGNQDIKTPEDPTNPGYQNLTLSGSGAKRLLGNVSVKGTYTLTAPATLDLNGFTLTNP